MILVFKISLKKGIDKSNKKETLCMSLSVNYSVNHEIVKTNNRLKYRLLGINDSGILTLVVWISAYT